jgi:hypothetical protein
MCVFASARQWRQCNSSDGSEAVRQMGRCSAAATCANCATCVRAVGDFVETQQHILDAATVAANFGAAAPSILVGLGDLKASVTDLAGIQAAIRLSNSGNMGKRAGALCAQMQCEYGRPAREG